jgi:hypothetical protein
MLSNNLFENKNHKQKKHYREQYFEITEIVAKSANLPNWKHKQDKRLLTK